MYSADDRSGPGVQRFTQFPMIMHRTLLAAVLRPEKVSNVMIGNRCSQDTERDGPIMFPCTAQERE